MLQKEIGHIKSEYVEQESETKCQKWKTILCTCITKWSQLPGGSLVLTLVSLPNRSDRNLAVDF